VGSFLKIVIGMFKKAALQWAIGLLSARAQARSDQQDDDLVAADFFDL
jgi:hypothetical protein